MNHHYLDITADIWNFLSCRWTFLPHCWDPSGIPSPLLTTNRNLLCTNVRSNDIDFSAMESLQHTDQKPSYPGERLRDRHIRLVKLHSGDWSSDIRCTLSNADLGSHPGFGGHPEYVALSYVWGSQRVKRTIWINNQQFNVTLNLESALRHIRHVQRGKDIVLWIDAICIDQGDTKERTHQVGMMGTIYRSCKHVIVYLGDQLRSRHNAHPLSRPPHIQEFSDHLEYSKTEDASLQGSECGRHENGQKYGSAQIFAFIQSIALGNHLPSTVVNSTPLYEALRQLMHSPWTPWWSRI